MSADILDLSQSYISKDSKENIAATKLNARKAHYERRMRNRPDLDKDNTVCIMGRSYVNQHAQLSSMNPTSPKQNIQVSKEAGTGLMKKKDTLKIGLDVSQNQLIFDNIPGMVSDQSPKASETASF